MDVLVLFPNPRILLLSPMFFWTGFELAFWTGEFPQLLDPSVRRCLPFPGADRVLTDACAHVLQTIGLVLMFAGVAEVVGGLVVGWLSDRLGRSLTVLLGTLFYGAYKE